MGNHSQVEPHVHFLTVKSWNKIMRDVFLQINILTNKMAHLEMK